MLDRKLQIKLLIEDTLTLLSAMTLFYSQLNSSLFPFLSE